MVVCSLCKRDGHLKKDCPEDFKKVKLDPLPPATPEFLDVLGQVCEQCYSECDRCLVISASVCFLSATAKVFKLNSDVLQQQVK